MGVDIVNCIMSNGDISIAFFRNQLQSRLVSLQTVIMLVALGMGPLMLPVEIGHLRTSPWSGQAAIESASMATASCLQLRGRVRRISKNHLWN
jgi:hypothetical protein